MSLCEREQLNESYFIRNSLVFVGFRFLWCPVFHVPWCPMVSYGFRSHFPRNSWRPLTSTGCSASEAAPRRVDPGRTRNPDRTLVESIHGNPKSQVFRKSLLRSLRGSKSSKFRSFTSFSSAMAMSIYSTLGNPVPTSGLQKSSQRPSKKDITASIAPPRALTV